MAASLAAPGLAGALGCSHFSWNWLPLVKLNFRYSKQAMNWFKGHIRSLLPYPWVWLTVRRLPLARHWRGFCPVRKANILTYTPFEASVLRQFMATLCLRTAVCKCRSSP